MTDKVHAALSEWADGFGAAYERREPFKYDPLENGGAAVIFGKSYRVTAGTEDGVEHIFHVRRFPKYQGLLDAGVEWFVRWTKDGKDIGTGAPVDDEDVLELFHSFTLEMETDWP